MLTGWSSSRASPPAIWVPVTLGSDVPPVSRTWGSTVAARPLLPLAGLASGLLATTSCDAASAARTWLTLLPSNDSRTLAP